MGYVDRATKDFVLRRDGYRCLLCHSSEDLTMDHIRPRSKGGTDEPVNLQTLCWTCNQEKGNKDNRYANDYRNNKSDRAIRSMKSFGRKPKKVIKKLKHK